MIRFDNHAFKGLDDALRQLFDMLQTMGGQAQGVLEILPRALEENNPEHFQKAKEIDKAINDAELRVDAAVASLIGKYTISGEDLRFVLAAVKVAGTLERAADKLKNCAKRLGKVTHPITAPVKAQLARAIAALEAMMPLALAQMLDYQPEVTLQLLGHGASVQKAYREILLHLHAHESTAEDETHLLLIAKNLEQTADMAVEVMKVAHFVHTGTKYDKRAQA